jgi:hypothetical protein
MFVVISEERRKALDAAGTTVLLFDTFHFWEDEQLKDAVQMFGTYSRRQELENIAAMVPSRTNCCTMVPSRTKLHCNNRWHDAFDPSVDRTSLSTGKWSTEEDDHLKDAVVQRHGGKNWTTIAALVPGRTKIQCSGRWFDGLDSTSTDQTPGRTGKWTAEEDDQLKDAVQGHVGRNWIGIAALVPGRTKKQRSGRWHSFL